MNCGNCHQPLEQGAQFCGNCGTPVLQVAAAPVAPVVASVPVPMASAAPQPPITSPIQGVAPPVYNQAPTVMPQQQPMNPIPGQFAQASNIKDYMVFSAIVTFFCTLPGAIGLYYSFQVRSALQRGDTVGAQKASTAAKTADIIGVIISVLIIILYMMVPAES